MQGKNHWLRALMAVLIVLAATSYASTLSAQTCQDSVCNLTRVLADSKAYKVNVKRWKASLKERPLAGVSWIGPLAGNGKRDRRHKNGGRDTFIFVPYAIDFSKEVTLIVWCHGLGGFKLQSPRLSDSIDQLLVQQKNFILVAPEMPWSTNTSTPRKRQSFVWNGRGEESFAVFYTSAMRTIITNFHPDKKTRDLCRLHGRCKSPANLKNIIIGHSAGGSAVRMAAKTGGLNIMSPDLIVYSDASYGRWADQTWKYYVKQHPECRFILLVRKGDKPYNNAQRLIKSLGSQHRRRIEIKIFDRRRWSHRDIGDRSMYMDIVWEEVNIE